MSRQLNSFRSFIVHERKTIIFFKKYNQNFHHADLSECMKGVAHHIFVLMQISYTYIVWNNFPKFQENRAISF